MKFTCTRENLTHALDISSTLAGKQTSLPILSNILIEATDSSVVLSSTNLESAVKTTIRARVEEKGSFSVPAKTISDYVRLLGDEQIEISLVGNELNVKCGNSSTKIKGSPSDEYPVIPEVEESHAFTLDAIALKEALSRAVIAVAKNEIRPELSGVYFSFFKDGARGLILAATDSYRLAEVKIDVLQGSDSVNCIVPGRVVNEMVRLLGVGKNIDSETQARLWVSENQIALRYDSFELTARLIDGSYPDYTQIIPTNFKTTTVLPLDIVTKKIKAASLFTTVGVNAVSFDLNASENSVGISSVSTQTGEHSSAIDTEVSGEENSILLNHRYVLDGLQNLQTDGVEFCVNSGDAPCLFKPKEKDNYLYIVMPIRQ